MKYYIILILLLIVKISYAEPQASPEPTTEPEVPLPSLGSCDEYTDYYIYQCTPFKCRLQIGPYQGVEREMEVLGYENNKCVHKIKFIMRNKAYPPSESFISCRLNERGRLQMANLFTRYKKGDLKAYIDPVMPLDLKQQCIFGRTKQP